MTHSTPGADVAASAIAASHSGSTTTSSSVRTTHAPSATASAAVVRPGRAGHRLAAGSARRSTGGPAPSRARRRGSRRSSARCRRPRRRRSGSAARRANPGSAAADRPGPWSRSARSGAGRSRRVALRPGEPLEIRRVGLDVAQHLRQPLGQPVGSSPSGGTSTAPSVTGTPCARTKTRARPPSVGGSPAQRRELHVVGLHRATGQRHHVNITRTESSPTENVPLVHGQGSHSDDD